MFASFQDNLALLYVTQQLVISVFLTLMSNFFIKRHKNFDQLVAKIDSLNNELEQLENQISMSQE